MNKKFKETEIGWIPEEWDLKSLGDLSEIKGGKRLTKGHTLVEYKTNHPYIRVTDLIDFGVNTDNILYLREETFEKIRNYTINSNDVYISIVGTVGLVGLIPKKLNGANLTENCAKITNINEIKKEFLAFFLKSRFGQQQIKMLTVGSTQGKLALSRIKKIKIPIPPLEEQIEICNLLYSLTNKIEINQKMNQTLEEIGQAIFKHWFVHFEFPNEEGKPYKSNAGEMVDSELGEIPKDWEVFSLGDLCSSISETYDLKNKDENFFLNTGDLFDGKVINHQFSDVESLPGQAKKKIRKNDILYSEIRPANRRFAFVDFNAEEYVVSTKLMVLRANDNITPELLFQFLKIHSIIEYFQGLAESRSGTFPQITFDTIKHIQITLPKNKENLEELGSIFASILKKTNQNVSQNKSLIEIRDSLLPKLMSGKIRVPLEEK